MPLKNPIRPIADQIVAGPYMVVVSQLPKSKALKDLNHNVVVNPGSVITLPMTEYQKVLKSNSGKEVDGLVIVAKNLEEAPDINPKNIGEWRAKASKMVADLKPKAPVVEAEEKEGILDAIKGKFSKQKKKED